MVCVTPRCCLLLFVDSTCRHGAESFTGRAGRAVAKGGRSHDNAIGFIALIFDGQSRAFQFQCTNLSSWIPNDEKKHMYVAYESCTCKVKLNYTPDKTQAKTCHEFWLCSKTYNVSVVTVDGMRCAAKAIVANTPEYGVGVQKQSWQIRQNTGWAPRRP